MVFGIIHGGAVDAHYGHLGFTVSNQLTRKEYDMKKIQSDMRLDRITKGAVLYKNVREGQPEAMTNLYLRKSGLTEPYPEIIHITIEIEAHEDD